MYDIIIKNGTVIDGSGTRSFSSDIGIKEDVIKRIGDLSGETADRIIDASGCYVTPGFVDVNNHSDTYWQIFLQPGLESLLYQGVTTIVGGNCGSSLAPLVDKSLLQSLQKWADVQKVNLNWLTVDEFLAEISRHKTAVNFATLAGHNTLRRGMVGDEMRNLREDELDVEIGMLRQALKDGALGVSSGLVYAHSRRASRQELLRLAEETKQKKGVYTFHLRGESVDLLRSLEEAILIAKLTGVRLHISHLKAVGEDAWPLMEKALYAIETASLDGVEITFDVYPYTHIGSVLYTLLPEWVTDGGKKMMLERLRDPGIRYEIVRELQSRKWNYDRAILLNSSLNKMMAHDSLKHIADMQMKTPEEVLVDALVASDGRATASLNILSEENVEKAVQHPFSIIASNGSGYSVEHANTGESVHPRSFGAFPRVLETYVRERKLLSWEEAIHKMTGKPAGVFNIQNRGLLRKGYHADIVIFRPESVEAPATIDRPYRYAKGMEWVLVNGAVAVERGVATDVRAGIVVRRHSSWF